MTHPAPDGPRPQTLNAPWLVRFPVRTPTLPPATHTNTYVIGEGELAVIDPASPWADEQGALADYLAARQAAGERITAIVLTHHHVDHVSGAAVLARACGAPLLAHPTTAALLAGRLVVDRLIDEASELRFGPADLAPLFTPGHAPGHLAFLDRPSRALIAGDMVATVGTIIVDPPEGDMRLYLASLARLRDLGAAWLLPAHGPPVDDPERLLRFYIDHRLMREARVLAAVAAGAATIEALVPRAYADLAPSLYPLAARSLLAHLEKLRHDGAVVQEQERWAKA